MRCACLMGGVCGAGVIRCMRGSMPVMGRLVYGVEISCEISYVPGSAGCCGALPCGVRAL